jgi:hypothetical protein
LNLALFVAADVQHLPGAGSVDDSGGFGLRARRFLPGYLLSFIEDIRVPLFALPRGGARNAERFSPAASSGFIRLSDEHLDFIR